MIHDWPGLKHFPMLSFTQDCTKCFICI